MLVHLIRHGETVANADANVVGGIDTLLTDNGVEQSQRLGAFLRRNRIRFDAVYSSPYARAMHTAGLVCDELEDEHDIIYDRRLIEIHRGEWDGRPIAEVITNVVRIEMTRQGLDFRAPGGESMRDVGDRMYSWLSDVQKTGHNNVAAFTHGHAIRCLLHRLFGFNDDAVRFIGVYNTSVTTVRYDDRHGWKLECLNTTPHAPQFIGPVDRSWSVQ